MTAIPVREEGECLQTVLIEVFLNAFAKGLAKILPIIVCDGIINLQINKRTYDFCQIYLLDKRCSIRFCMVY